MANDTTLSERPSASPTTEHHNDERERMPLSSAARNMIIICALWALLVIASTIHSSNFLSHQTLVAITYTMAISGILATGLALVAISGGILDLSVPTALIGPAWVLAAALDHGWSPLVALVACLAAGALWGLVNASIIVFGKINPVVVTLATNFFGVAAFHLVFSQAQVPLGSGFRTFGGGSTLGLPNVFWVMVVLIAAVGYLIPRTRYGRRMTAVGGNPQAARARGISLRKTRFAVFTFSGLCGGIAAVLFAGSNGGFTPDDGTSLLLPVIAAVILADIPLQGGRGNVWLIFVSIGFLSTIPTALVFFGLSSSWQTVFQGFILLIAVSVDGLRRRKAQP